MKEARFRTVQLRIWDDARFRALSADGRILFFRLLVAPKACSLAILIPIGLAALAEKLGWAVEAVRSAFAELEAATLARADWGARLVFFPIGWEHDRPRNQWTILGWHRPILELPDCPLKLEARAWLATQIGALNKPSKAGKRDDLDLVSAFERAWPATPCRAPSTTQCLAPCEQPPPAPTSYLLPPKEEEKIAADKQPPVSNLSQPRKRRQPTAEEKQCRDTISERIAAEQQKRTGKAFAWNAKERTGVSSLATICGNAPAEALKLIEESIARGAAGDRLFAERGLLPSFIASQVNVLRVPKALARRPGAATPFHEPSSPRKAGKEIM